MQQTAQVGQRRRERCAAVMDWRQLMPDEKKSERSKVKVGQFRRERSPHSHRFLQSKTEERKRSFLFSPPPLPAFPSPLGRMGTRSRAAVIPLLARLALLLSVTRAQVSVLFFFHLKSTRRRNRSMSYRPKPRRLFPDSGGRGRGYRSLILLAVLGRVWFRATHEVLRGQQTLAGCGDRDGFCAMANKLKPQAMHPPLSSFRHERPHR